MKTLITRSIGAGLNTLAYIAPEKAAQLGFELFCRPMRVPIREKQKAFFDTAVQETFNHQGVDIQTYRWGNGKKNVLLLHGWKSHSYRWKPYIEALREDHTVFTLDAPGHGLSGGKFLSVPLYSEVIEEQIKRIGNVDTIITHSLGGFSTLYTFYRNPRLSANKVITLASPGEAQEFFNFYAKSLKLTDRSTKLIMKHFQQVFQRTPEFFSAPAFAEAMTIPGLIIHDEDDDETPFFHAERIHRAWKNSKLVKTKGLGHNLRSTDIVKEVVRFVKAPLTEHFTPAILAADNHQ